MKQFSKEYMFPFYKEYIFSLLNSYTEEIETWIKTSSTNNQAKGFLVTNLIVDLIDFISDFVEHPTKDDVNERHSDLEAIKETV